MSNGLLTLFAGLTFCSGPAAFADGQPYQAIISRNVFGLKDPPPPPPTVEPAKPAPKPTLTGIITFGKARALLKASPTPPKPGEQAKGEQSFILGEGERQDDVQVVSINPVLGKVTLNIGGESMTIGFEDKPVSKGGIPRTTFGPSPSIPSALAPQQVPVADAPGSEPAQVAMPVQAAEVAWAMAVQPQGQADLGAVAQTARNGFQAAGSGNPYAYGKAIQHPGFDPSPGAVQRRMPFPTRSLRGRGRAAYTAVQTLNPAGDAPSQAGPQ